MSGRRLPSQKVCRAPPSCRRDRRGILVRWEPLESRRHLAITASFVSGVLTVSGDALANGIIVSRNVAGGIIVNGGAVVISGGAPTVANTARIDVLGFGEADALNLDEV